MPTCKQCGHQQDRVIFRPVYPPVAPFPDDGLAPAPDLRVYKRWACDKCGRFHFADGSLYSNPFAKGEKLGAEVGALHLISGGK